jgi:MFS family permease
LFDGKYRCLVIAGVGVAAFQQLQGANAFTWAPLTWVLVGENFPLAIRGRASGIASSFNWIGSFAVGLLFPIMTALMSQDAVFAIFGAICTLGVLFVRTRVPETRGRTLDDIETRSIPTQEAFVSHERKTVHQVAQE